MLWSTACLQMEPRAHHQCDGLLRSPSCVASSGGSGIFRNGLDRNHNCQVDSPRKNPPVPPSESSQYSGKCFKAGTKVHFALQIRANADNRTVHGDSVRKANQHLVTCSIDRNKLLHRQLWVKMSKNIQSMPLSFDFRVQKRQFAARNQETVRHPFAKSPAKSPANSPVSTAFHENSLRLSAMVIQRCRNLHRPLGIFLSRLPHPDFTSIFPRPASPFDGGKYHLGGRNRRSLPRRWVARQAKVL